MGECMVEVSEGRVGKWVENARVSAFVQECEGRGWGEGEGVGCMG